MNKSDDSYYGLESFELVRAFFNAILHFLVTSLHYKFYAQLVVLESDYCIYCIV
jgi:hypothetical protein